MKKILKYGVQSCVLALFFLKGHSVLLEKAELVKSSGVDIVHNSLLPGILFSLTILPVILYALYCILMTLDSLILILPKKYREWYY